MTVMPNTAKANRVQLMLFWDILLFAFLIRLLYFGDIPGGINQDEAMAAVDALALSQYGTDRYGIAWPVHFKAWGYGQMSVLLSYCMIPFIKLFGFHTFAIRLPMLLISTAGIALIYLTGRKFFSVNLSLGVMAFTAINPWHFMQSRWSLDCNIFPHVFLLAFYLLLSGLEKRRYLYFSMIVFGLTFYSYGVAIYTVPVFLFIYAAWCLLKKQLTRKEILLSAGIFLTVALPEILTIFINMFRLPTIETPFFTIPFFPDSVRSNDILFLNFSVHQLGRNALSMLKQAFLQRPDFLFNALPGVGALYSISIPFLFAGIWQFFKRCLKQKDLVRQTRDAALCCFLIMGIWTGLTTFEVNINRINIIFYPLILFTVYGISCFIGLFGKYKAYLRRSFLTGYSILAISFFVQYFTLFPTEIRTMFNVDFLKIIKEADSLENYDSLYVSSNMGWQTNYYMAEILTHYSCRIDARYYQGLTNENLGRSLLPYSMRYHFVDLCYQTAFDSDALYVIHQGDLADIEKRYTKGYDVILEQGDFLAVDLK